MINYIPNTLTIIRLLSVIPYVLFFIKRDYLFALLIFLFAGFTDILDGLLARKYKCVSKLGSMLDPAADKVLIITSLILLYSINLLPLFFVILLISRDIIIVLGVFLVQLMSRINIKYESLFLSKVNTVLQLLFIIMMLTILNIKINPSLAETSIHILFLNIFINLLPFCIVVSSVLSLAQYIYLGISYLRK